MKRVLVIMLGYVLALSPLISGPNSPRSIVLGGRSSISTRVLDANRLWLAINDRGCLNFDSLAWDAGSHWWLSADSYHAIVFDQGPWIIGKFNGSVAAGTTLWRSSYSPGPVIGGRPALDVQPWDSTRYHPYKISLGESERDSDVLLWPADLGAPCDAQGRPMVLGDQMIWGVYNAADTNLFADGWDVDFTLKRKQQFPRLPVEIQQAVYGRKSTDFADTSLLANTAFEEWTFINKGSVPVESCYVGLWADIDIGIPPLGIDFTAIDTTLQLGYLWLKDTTHYERFAVGYSLLYGPTVPSSGGSAVFRGRVRAGYRNLPLSSFLGISQNWHVDSLFGSAPANVNAAWNVARGFDKLGNIIIDSVTQQPTRFPFSGDPVTGAGWIDTRDNKAEAGILMFTGPFSLAPGDTQWMMAALVPANAGEPIASVTLLRNLTARLRAMTYEEIANPQPLSVRAPETVLPEEARLGQNYPNPFNASTTIKYELPTSSDVQLTVYDILGREVSVLVKERKNAGSYEVKFDGIRLASGVYFYRLRAGDFVGTKRLLLIR